MAGVKMLLVRGNMHDNKRGAGGSACDRVPTIFTALIGAEGCRINALRLDGNKGNKRACDAEGNNASQEAERAPTLMLSDLCIFFTGAPLISFTSAEGKIQIKNCQGAFCCPKKMLQQICN